MEYYKKEKKTRLLNIMKFIQRLFCMTYSNLL